MLIGSIITYYQNIILEVVRCLALDDWQSTWLAVVGTVQEKIRSSDNQFKLITNSKKTSSGGRVCPHIVVVN